MLPKWPSDFRISFQSLSACYHFLESQLNLERAIQFHLPYNYLFSPYFSNYWQNAPANAFISVYYYTSIPFQFTPVEVLKDVRL